ncbi:hypothetical protein JXA02_14900 [candidate division KSB1 bacterium]|nr:hypothetical protein [candidate division KSB1 bacterium]
MRKKIKLDATLYERARAYAAMVGYSSVEEFIIHLLEKEMEKMADEKKTAEQVEKKLRGLGYLA